MQIHAARVEHLLYKNGIMVNVYRGDEGPAMKIMIDGAQQLANAFHGQKVVRRTVRGCFHATALCWP